MINSHKYIIIERNQMGKIFREQGFQRTGCTDISCAVEAGKMLSANKILVGTVMKFGNSIIITGRIVDVKEGVAEFSHDQKTKSRNELYATVKLFSKNFSDKVTGEYIEYDDNENIKELTRQREIAREIEIENRKIEYEVIKSSKNRRGKLRFLDNDDGTITDSKTGLIWLKKTYKKRMNWNQAMSYALENNNGNQFDWRLPTKKELSSLLIGGKQSSFFLLKKHGFKNMKDDSYWTSSESSENSSGAWVIDISTDYAEVNNKDIEYYILLVCGKMKK